MGVLRDINYSHLVLPSSGISRAATLVIAANDSTDKCKSQSDYVCTGTADNVRIQEAIDATEGDHYLQGGTYNTAAKVNVKANRHLILAHNAVIKPASDIDILQQYHAARISGGILDVRDLGAGNYTSKAILIQARDPDEVNLGTNIANSTSGIDNIRILGDESGSTFGGTGIYLYAHNDDGSAVINGLLFDNIQVYGAFEYGIRLNADGTGGNNYIRSNEFHKIYIHNAKYGFIEEALCADSKGAEHSRLIHVVVQGLGASNLTAFQIAGQGNCLLGCVDDNVVGGNTLVFLSDSHDNLAIGNFRSVSDSGSRNAVLQARASGVVSTRHYFEMGKPRYLNQAILPLNNPLGAAALNADFIFPFQDGSGAIAKDISHNEVTATLVNSPTWDTITETNWGCLLLDAATEHLTLDSIALNSDWTIIVAYEPDYDYDDDTHHRILDWYVSDSNYFKVEKMAGDPFFDALQVEFAGGGTYSRVRRVIPFSSGDKLIIVITFDNSTGEVKFFLNGTPLGSDTGAGTISATTPTLYMGIGNDATSYPANGKYAFLAMVAHTFNDSKAIETCEALSNLIGRSHERISGYPHKVQCPTALDLSGAATDVEAYHAVKAGYLTGYTILYTEASSADTGVNIQVGRYQDGVALDGDYFDVSASEVSKSLGYAKHFTMDDLSQFRIAAGDTITVGHAGSKTGAGEVKIILEITED